MRRGLFVALTLSSFVGCSLFTDLDGFSTGPTVPDSSQDRLDGNASADAPAPLVTDATSDGNVQDANAPDADATTTPAKTTVSCTEPSVCADHAGCCVVYSGAADFCTDTLEKCTFPDSRTVWAQCDDETDCAALGHPGNVCCATISPDNTLAGVACTAPAACMGTLLCDATMKSCPSGKSCVKGAHASDLWSCESP